MNLPFKQKLKNGSLIREFSQHTSASELVWHRDHNDRTVVVVEGTGWSLQMDNQLPVLLEVGKQYYIPKNTYHRVVKGTTKLVLEINEMKPLLRECIREQLIVSQPFDTLVEYYDRGIITEKRMVLLWEQRVDTSISTLLNEAFMDDLAAGYEFVKGKAIAVKDVLSQAAISAWEKANNLVFELVMQATEIAMRSITALKAVVNKLSALNDRFKKSHPLLHRIVTILIAMIIIFAIMALFSKSAHAGVKTASGKMMTKGEYTAARGMLDQYSGKQDAFDIARAIEILDDAYKSSKTVDISELGEINKGAYKVIQQLSKEASSGDEMAADVLRQWLAAGKKLQSVKVTGGV